MTAYSLINFHSVPLNDLCDYVTDRFHSEVLNHISLINSQIDKIPASGCAVDKETLKSRFAAFQGILENHLRKEATILFPFVQALMSTDKPKSNDHRLDMLDNSLSVMIQEHRNLEAELNTIRALTQEYRPECTGEFPYLCFVSLFDLDFTIRRLFYLEEVVLFKRMKETARLRQANA